MRASVTTLPAEQCCVVFCCVCACRYAKRSNKKHKSYQDGVLVVRGAKVCTLRSMEDKVMVPRICCCG